MTESEFLHMFGWMNRSTSWQREYEAIERLRQEVKDLQESRNSVVKSSGKVILELKADAERYRWLRDECIDNEPMVDGDSYWVRSVHFEFSSTTTLDAAIDAARKQT